MYVITSIKIYYINKPKLKEISFPSINHLKLVVTYLNVRYLSQNSTFVLFFSDLKLWLGQFKPPFNISQSTLQEQTRISDSGNVLVSYIPTLMKACDTIQQTHFATKFNFFNHQKHTRPFTVHTTLQSIYSDHFVTLILLSAHFFFFLFFFSLPLFVVCYFEQFFCS